MTIGAGVVQSVYPTTDWTTDDQSSVEAKDYSSSLCVQTSSEPPVQCVPGVVFPGVKRGRYVTLATYPYLVPRSRMTTSYTSSSP
jgi:hypothetical protein